MINTLKLLLPAIIPSWRFFENIAPSPRIEFILLKTKKSKTKNWQKFRPRPKHLSIAQMFKRMFWNPHWNESLFLVSCAERLTINPTKHSEQEILKRVKSGLELNHNEIISTPYLQFRLVFINRYKTKIKKQTTFISPIYSYIEDINK